jgi:hypothetical protein
VPSISEQIDYFPSRLSSIPDRLFSLGFEPPQARITRQNTIQKNNNGFQQVNPNPDSPKKAI